MSFLNTLDETDTPLSAALKMRIRELEVENATLRAGKGIWPSQEIVTAIPSLQENRIPYSVASSGEPLKLTASWEMKISPQTGKFHAIGVAFSGADPEKEHLFYNYYSEPLLAVRPEHQAYILGELHKGALRALGKTVFDFYAGWQASKGSTSAEVRQAVERQAVRQA